ncbi:glycine-rich RNA-binding protein 2, mitochondrial-like isoform X4 [Euphorbia lathyris]|uniref:glycine-rich RNA-binding protein 2, mitochondrial-like isoform X4 n=1 Tax=Euphorbia lathyris TaxID=212925 RepID=UPI003313A305
MNRALISIARRATEATTLHSPPPNSKLFVAGLSWSVDEKSLQDAFSSFGAVSEVKIMYDKDSGRSRGFGFVSFSEEGQAISAKDAMDGIVRKAIESLLCSRKSSRWGGCCPSFHVG